MKPVNWNFTYRDLEIMLIGLQATSLLPDDRPRLKLIRIIEKLLLTKSE